MENNFGQILLSQVSTNKDKFLGLLRRNGVLVNTNVSDIDLTNMILRAMQKSETFKKETILFMGVLMSNNSKNSFANMSGYSNFTGSSFNPSNPFGGVQTFDPNANPFGLSSGASASTSVNTTSTTNNKEFEDTAVGKITGQLFGAFDKFLQSKELDVRKEEAKAGQVISENKVKTKDDEKSNVGLYVGLAIGGLAVVGLVVYLVTKKK
jgi:hypothetical protein